MLLGRCPRVLAWLAAEKGQIYADAALFSAITAMRRGEVCRILWADLDDEKKMVLIRDRKDPRQKVGTILEEPLVINTRDSAEQRRVKGERACSGSDHRWRGNSR